MKIANDVLTVEDADLLNLSDEARAACTAQAQDPRRNMTLPQMMSGILTDWIASCKRTARDNALQAAIADLTAAYQADPSVLDTVSATLAQTQTLGVGVQTKGVVTATPIQP